MKTLPALLCIIALAPTLAATPANASCSSRGVYLITPEDQARGPRAVDVVVGYGDDQEAVLNATGARYESDSGLVPAEILERHQGMFRVSQILVRPSYPLTPGVAWKLRIVGVDKTLQRRVAESPARQGRPRLLSSPELVRHTVQQFGCGPAIHEEVALPSEGVALARVVLALKDGTVHTWVLPLDDEQKVRVGHGMCSGGFDFEAADAQRLRIEPLTAEGELAAAPFGADVALKAPLLEGAPAP